MASILRTMIDQFPSSTEGPRITSLPGSQPPQPDPEFVVINDIIQERLRQWDLGIDPQLSYPKFTAGQYLAITAYKHLLSPTVQAEIALYTGLAFIIDDQLVLTQAVQEFAPRFCSGSRQLHPVLDYFVATCHALSKYFPTYGASSIYASTIDFVNSDCHQNEKEAKEMSLYGDSVPFIDFMRERDGIAVAYTAFIWLREEFPSTAEYIQVFP